MTWWWTLALLLGPVDDRHVGWLPEMLAGARRLEAPRVWDRQTVFDYMDGKAEIYLTYSLVQVTTAPYQLGDQRVEVILFDLDSPAEAFGVFSSDLEGEKLPGLQDSRYVPGLFRGWHGRLVVKVEAGDDFPALRPFASALAREIAAREPAGPDRPPLAAALPLDRLHLTDLRYFHTVTSLDNIFYLSTRNVLGLDLTTAALFADGKLHDRPLHVLLVQYREAAQRDRAWDDVGSVVLSDAALAGPGGERAEELAPGLFTGLRRVDGPAGEPRLVLCLDAASREDCLAGLAALAGTAGPREEPR